MGCNGKSFILIIDDTPQNLQLTGTLLSENGYEVAMFQNGTDALESVADNRPDLILLDTVMPEMDGYEVCCKLKQMAENRSIPIIFMTTMGEPEDIVKLFEVGGVDYIIRPFHSVKLISLVKTHIRLKKLEEYKKMQEKLMVEERFAAVGKLVTTVAHEINSPLQGISVIISLLQNKYGKDKLLLENLNLIHEGFDSIKKTVRKLMDLSRSGKEEKEIVNINDIIRETIMMLRPQTRKASVKVHPRLSPSVPAIPLAQSHVIHIFSNLINNSIDAMAEQKKNKKILITSNFDSDQIIVLFENTGPAVSKEVFQYLFDPFYTTKKVGGMGIGLYSTRKYIENHNGTINVENLEPRGCLFKIKIPVQPSLT